MKYVFYNSVTGDIYSVKKMSPTTAQHNCDRNSQFNMACVSEDSVGFVLNKDTQKIDLDTMTLVSKAPVVKITVPHQIRQKRNHLLKSTDWTQVPDGPLNATQKTAWQTYRSALRAINPDDYTNLGDVTWPTEPKKHKKYK